MQLVRLGDVAQINPRIDKSSLADDVPVSFVQMASVGAADGKINVSIVRPFAEVKKGSYTPFKDGDVLFAKVTPCMENGKMAVARGLTNGVGFGSSEFHVLRPSDQVDAKYLYYFVSSQAFRKEAAGHMTGAVGLRRVPSAFLADAQLPLVPLDEQRRIVAEIEQQFSRLDEAVANLLRVKANLKRYKASVLKAAVEGRLVETEASIAQREGRSYETGEQLLQRILDERREMWVGRGKYKEPVSPRIDHTFELPQGWAWATLGHLSLSVKDGPHYSPKYVDDGIPFISGGNVRPEGIDFTSTKYISKELHQELSKRCKPEVGDLLYTKGGTTGIARVNTDPREFNVWVHVAVLKLAKSLHRFYVQHALNSQHCYRQAQEYTHGVGNQDLGLTRMVWITVPLPPLAEQARIVAEVDRHLSIIREVEAEVDVNIQRSQALRQVTLSQFLGDNIK